MDQSDRQSFAPLLTVMCLVTFGCNFAVSMRLPIVPLYARGFGVSTAQQFERGCTSSTFGESTRIPATFVPQALIPFLIPPAALTVATQNMQNIDRGGFNLIAGTEEQMATKLQAFIDGSGDDNAH